MEKYKLESRIFKRGGEPEVRFVFSDPQRALPILHQGHMRIVQWGSLLSESKRLPIGGWVTQEQLTRGKWSNIEKHAVEIPATMGLEKGIWFRIRQGIHGVLVTNEHTQDIVYLLCERSSHYFHVMTRSTRMPLLIDERI